MAGGQLSAAAPPPRPRLQLELSLEGRRHFLCPLPLISRHSWQVQRRGSKDREGAAANPLANPLTGRAPGPGRGKGAHGAQSRPRGSGARRGRLPWGGCQARGPQAQHEGTGTQAAHTPAAGFRLEACGPGLLEAPPGHRGARWAGVQVTVPSPATEPPHRRATRRCSQASRKVGQAGLATTRSG